MHLENTRSASVFLIYFPFIINLVPFEREIRRNVGEIPVYILLKSAEGEGYIEKRPLEVGWGVSDREGQILPTKIIFCPQSDRFLDLILGSVFPCNGNTDSDGSAAFTVLDLC